MARPAHLRSLKDAQRVAWREFPMSHEIGPERTCRRTRRRILIKLPGKHSARTRFAVGNKFRFEFRIEIFGRKSKRRRKFLLVMFCWLKGRPLRPNLVAYTTPAS